jgi:hypothetical protein
VKLIGRGSERGYAVRRKQGPMLLGRGNIPGALSKAPKCNPGILHSLRHVLGLVLARGYRVVCTCHCNLLFMVTSISNL